MFVSEAAGAPWLISEMCVPVRGLMFDVLSEMETLSEFGFAGFRLLRLTFGRYEVPGISMSSHACAVGDLVVRVVL